MNKTKMICLDMDDTLNLTQCDLELIRNALTALVNASSIVTHDNVMTAD